MPLSAQMTAFIRATQTGTNDYGGPTFSPSVEANYTAVDGTGAGQVDLIFCDERTVTTGANDDLDLAGVLTSALGATMTFVEIVGIMVINAPRSGAANTTNLTIGGGTNPVTGFLGGTTPTIGPIRPGGVFMIWNSENAAGFGAVVAATGDVLRVANSAGASATYQICVVGRSA